MQTWFYEKDLKFWFKDIGFGSVLNRIFDELPKFGSVVLKVIDNTPYFVDLRNFIVEASADHLGNANYIIERHNYTPMEYRKAAKQFKWDKTEEVLESFRKGKNKYITVYERYGEVQETNDKGEATYLYKRVYMADVNLTQPLMSPFLNVPSGKGIIIEEDEAETHPYYEFHLEKIPGRWLGVGVIEVLIDSQIRINELVNQQAKGTYWAALRLFQSRDSAVNRNLMIDVVNGEVLNSDSPITQIDMSDRNLAFFAEEHNKWLRNRDEMTFSYDVVRGERLPAGTPLGSARLATGQAMSFFDQVRENIALDIKKFLCDVIIPNFEKYNSNEHELKLLGEDVDKLNALYTQIETNRQILNAMLKSGKVPTKSELETLKEAISEVESKKERTTKIPKGFYKDCKYKIDIIITGESKDTEAMTQIFFAALQAITVDPTLLTDPNKKKLFYKALENSGINPVDIEPEFQTPREVMPQRAVGGGVSAPTSMPQMPMAETRL